MGTVGTGNFDNDGAMDYLGEIVEDLIETIEGCFTDEGTVRLDEGGEDILMPTVELLAILAEQCGASSPEPSIVAEWRDKYLESFDQQIEGLDPAPGYREERRGVIERTFTRLEQQAHQFWDNAESPGE